MMKDLFYTIVPPKDGLRSSLMTSPFVGRETDSAVVVVIVGVAESLFDE